MSDTGDFATCRAALRDIAGRRPASPERGYWIYGAGGFGRSIAAELQRVGQPVLGLIDRRAAELGSIGGLPCRHPDEIATQDLRGTHYVHGLLHDYGSSLPVLDWAKSLPFDAVDFVPQLFRLPGFQLENYWLTDPERTLEQLDAIEAFHDALDDEPSRALLRSLLAFRVSANPENRVDVTPSEIYVPPFLPIFDGPLVFVDAGAYTGDTLEQLLGAGARVSDWVAFEPDEANIVKLRETAERHREAVPNFTLMQAGLSDRNGTVRFAASNGAISRVISGDEAEVAGTVVEIPIMKLDDVVRRSGEVYVKMDIEGAELAALAGMTGLLRQRPILAISLYHRPSDLWEIPRFVAAHYDRPRMRLRQHRHHGFDTVLYVWPGEAAPS